ncbi:MAG TPA: type II toxin-antitoxin system HicB family antitoxin [Coriobacteriia bacterium]|nr:type II toxin-antitoxin system HicB family antitoxin [Coriobacteriia bacterium]
MTPQLISTHSDCVGIVSTDQGLAVRDDFALMWARRTLQEFSDADRTNADSRPTMLIDKYVGMAMRLAETERLDDRSYYAEIPGFAGVWADGGSKRAALRELESTLRAWIDAKITDGDHDLPLVGEINLNVL